MPKPDQIRFLTANFSYLQGLRAVPLGAGLLLITAWVNAFVHAPTNLLPIALPVGLGMLVSSWLIDRYYTRTFGVVKRAHLSLLVELAMMVGGGLLGLAAFWADISLHLPFVACGLLFAVGTLADYFRLLWMAQCRPFTVYRLAPVLAGLMGLISFMPMLDRVWLSQLGFHSPLLGVLILDSGLIILFGLWSHWYFTRTLAPKTETPHVATL